MSWFTSSQLYFQKEDQPTNQIIQDFSVALRLLLGNVEHVCHDGLEQASLALDILEVPQSFMGGGRKEKDVIIWQSREQGRTGTNL